MSRATLSIVREDRPVRPAIDDPALVFAASLLAVVAVLADAPAAVRVPLGLVAVLFLPGYSLTLALLPRADDIGRVERASLAVAVSTATVAALMLLLHHSALPLTPMAIVTTLTAWTLVITGIAWLRRRTIAPADRSAMLRGHRPSWRRLGPAGSRSGS